MLVVFVTAALVGVYLIAVGGWPILLVGLAAMLAAVAYTGGPWPFGHYGLGDLFVFIFFGLVAVCGTYYVQALTLTPMTLVAAVPVGALVTSILVVNNLRDLDTDRRAGKRTLAVYLGRRGAQTEYLILLILAYSVPISLWIGARWLPWVLLPLLTLPLAIRLGITILNTVDGPTLNTVLAGTARLGLLFSALFALGIAL